MNDLYINWKQYYQAIESLAIKIYQSKWKFDYIICIAKGGLRLGDILSRIYDLPLGVLFVSSYRDINDRVRKEIKFSEHLAMLEGKLEGCILLVDDLVDSGISLELSIAWLQKRFEANISEIRTGVLWYKKSSTIVPDYYVEYLDNNPWIHQPFEYYETITPEQLLSLNSSNQVEIE
jgi:hypothetical protein